MPRPKLHSDEAILEGARAVLKRCAPRDFTLQQVAKEVGISRAALIQRFTNRETLLRKVVERGLATTQQYLDALPVDCSARGLQAFLETLCELLGDGGELTGNFLFLCHEMSDKKLKKLSHARNLMVQEAISKRIPSSCFVPPQSAANFLHTVVSGSTMQWVMCNDGRLDEYVKQRVAVALSCLLPSKSPD